MKLSRTFAVQAGETIILPCPYSVGRLSSCYFGAWYRNNSVIVDVPSPGARCEFHQSFRVLDGSESEGRYLLIQSNFSLMIRDVKPHDSSTYRCKLASVNPIDDLGAEMTVYGLSPSVELSVGGKFIVIWMACQPQKLT